MAVCEQAPSFELLDCSGNVLRQISSMSLNEPMLKRLAEVLESDKKSKLAAEFPEFGMPGASAYLAHADGDYDRAHDMLLEVQQHYKELNAQHVHQLEADLQDAQQATEQAEFERDGAVADTDSAIEEGVHLAQQRDKFENLVQDLVEENEAFKAEAQMANIKLHAIEVKSKDLQREYQDARSFIATLDHEHWHNDGQLHSKLAECQAQVVNLQGIVAELSSEAAADMKLQLEHWHRDDQLHGKLAECQAQVVNLQDTVAELSSEAAADMGHKEEVLRVRGLLDDKQQEIEALQCRLANSQAHLQLKEHSLDGTLTCLQETQHELADSEGRLQVSRHELSDAQERLEGKVEQLEAMVERTTSELSQMMTRFREVEGKHIGSEETLATLGRAVDTHLARSSKSKKRSDEEFDSMFKERLDLTGENELLKHSHAALERTLESMQRDLDTANEWRLEAIEELDEVTDELTLLKETLHAQGLRLPN